ncbi:MAG: sigma-54 dependent transcriptional regulator [Myxococcaceae bacterium]|nr:sigma-54 dependent transcriptional regulator [Myxococcaceae bacterium]
MKHLPQELSRVAAGLGSMLRLQLVVELLRTPEGLRLEDAAQRTACPEEDVAACLRPMVGWGVVESLEGGRVWRLKGGLPHEMLEVLKRAIRQASEPLKRERLVREEILAGMVGTNPKMQLVTEMVRKVARLDVPVLITGETGTGKELVARAIHELSPRSQAFFGGVNCATLTDTLFESQVFGHAKGAFTGALKASEGLVERANGGTLFLDEIGELSLDNQAKLLRVLQSRTYNRLGETQERSSTFRLVSATNRHLSEMIRAGTFREDLYYRIDVFPIQLPALRERIDDLPLLAEEFARRGAGLSHRSSEAPAFTPAALDRLRRHPWPGNIRELENVVTRASIAAGDAVIDEQHLPPLKAAAPGAPAAASAPALQSLALAERDHIVAVLEQVGGNLSVAAAVLQISRTTLYRKLRENGLEVTRRVTSHP